MARNPPLAIRNSQAPNQIAVDFSACGAREDIKKKRKAGTVCILSRDKIWAVRGSVAPDREEEARKMEQEMLRILEEDEAKRARGGVADRASAHEKPMFTLEEIDALLSSEDEENGDREKPGADILTQEEIDALLQATESADSGHAADEVDDEFLAAMEEALAEMDQQPAEEEKRQAEREEPSALDGE